MRYAICTLQAAQDNLDSIVSKDVESLRKSVDGSLCIVKFEGARPSFLNGHDVYDLQSIHEILMTEGWSHE